MVNVVKVKEEEDGEVGMEEEGASVLHSDLYTATEPSRGGEGERKRKRWWRSWKW